MICQHQITCLLNAVNTKCIYIYVNHPALQGHQSTDVVRLRNLFSYAKHMLKHHMRIKIAFDYIKIQN